MQDADTQDDSQYRVHSRREIVALMRSMMDRNQLLTLLIKGGTESMITSILDVNEDDNQLVLDAAPGATLNQLIVESDSIAFEALYNSIRITFAADGAKKTTFEGRAALAVAIPPSLVRLQRREYFRIATPVVKPIRCTIRAPKADGTLTTVITMLNNISAGGIGITDENCVLDTTIGQVFEDCRLELTDNTVVSVRLQVRDVHDAKLTNGRVVRRFGCEFVDIQRAILAAIQRFITKIEREQNAKASGML